MPHQFGACELPVPVPDEGVAVSDPGLTALADFLKATLNAYVNTAWQSVAPGEPMVRFAFTHDPKEYGFEEHSVPALYLFRLKDDPEQIADDLEFCKSTVWCMWVYPPATNWKSVLRESIFNGFSKTVQAVVRLGRDPAWVHASDLDEDNDERDLYASTHGSGICRIAGFSRLKVDSVQQSELAVQLKGADASYPAILTTFTVEELLTTDPSIGTYPAKLELKVTTEEPDIDDALIFNERIRPDPAP